MFISLTVTLQVRACPITDLDDEVAMWIGSGTNTAYLVVDFDDLSTQSAELVFGVRYGDETATTTLGIELLEAVASATQLTYHDAGGGFIDRITYGPLDGDATQSYPPTWTFFESADLGLTYTTPWVGVASYVVEPDSMIAFSFTKGEWPGLAPNGPRISPEEFSLMEDTVEWIGEGSNWAYFVLDFNDSSTISAQDGELVFGYSYGDEAATSTLGLDLLDAVADATRLTYHDAGGGFIDHFTYGPFDGDATQSYPPTWAFFESVDFGQSYTTPWVGVGSYQVFPGSTIAFSFTEGEWPGSAPDGPRVLPAEFALMEDVVEWVGDGLNRTYFVLDFNASSTTEPNEFVFGLSYGDQLTTSLLGIEVMSQIAEATAMSYNAPDGGFGPFVNYIQYGLNFVGDATSSYPPTWSYWVSYDYTQTYSTSWVGVGGLTVLPGEVTAFRFTEGEWPGPPPNGPRSIEVQESSIVTAARHWLHYDR